MPKTPQYYFKEQIYRYILAFNEDKIKMWDQEMPKRYSTKEHYDNIGKDRKIKDKLPNYVAISREAQFEFTELYTQFIEGIIAVIDDVEITDDHAATLDAIADAHNEYEDFSIIYMIFKGMAEWTLDEDSILGQAKDPENKLQAMFENELDVLKDHEEILVLITIKFNHFVKIVSSIAAKLIWRDCIRTFNENALLGILDIMGVGDEFLDVMKSAAPIKKPRVRKVDADADADDADDDADADDAVNGKEEQDDDADDDAAAADDNIKDKKPAGKATGKKTGKTAGKATGKASAKKPAGKAAAKKSAGKATGKAAAKKSAGKAASKKTGKAAGKAATKTEVDSGDVDSDAADVDSDAADTPDVDSDAADTDNDSDDQEPEVDSGEYDE